MDIIGKKYGMLTVVREDGFYVKGNFKEKKYYCQCDCGNFKTVRKSSLSGGHIRSCGCLAHKVKGNRYEEYEDYIKGYDSKGEEFLIDKEDLDKIRQYTWYKGTNKYFRTTPPGTKKQIQMHRLILDILDKDDCLVDHINRNPSDNRKANLRIANYSENMANSKVSSKSTSGIRGVTYDKKCHRWRVRIAKDGKRYCLGSFIFLDEAVRVRKAAEEKYYGEYALKGE